jgi:hypothetical protein
LKGVRAFKSNWTQAVSQSNVTVDEQEDLVKAWLSSAWIEQEGIIECKRLLESQAGALAKVAEQAEIIRATPSKPRTVTFLDEKDDPPHRATLFNETELVEDSRSSMPTKLYLKKPEVMIVTQKSLDVLEYYAQLSELLTEMEVSDGELKMLFKSGLNSVTRELLPLCISTSESLEKLVKELCELSDISASNVITERDRLYQRASEIPLQFLVRWKRVERKAKLLDVKLDFEDPAVFATRLLGTDTLSALF